MPTAEALQELLDKQEITELQSRYMWALDWRDADMYADCFTEDGRMLWPEGSAEGREAIHASCARMGEYYARLAAASAPLKPFRLRHFLANRVFDIKGDRARAWAYWMDINNDNLQRWPQVPGYGYYEDNLLRTADGWRFTSRMIYNEVSGESPDANPLRNLI